jgi:lysophospholipase L1-like esterase
MKSFTDEVDVEAFYRLPTHHTETYRFLNSPRPVRNWLAFTRMLSDFGTGTSMREQVKLGRATDAELRDTDLDIRWAETEGMNYWRSNIQDFVNAVKSDGATPILVTQGTLLTADLSAEHRAQLRYKFVQVGHADIVEITGAMNNILAQVAKKEGAPFLDVRGEINGEPSYFSDHVHLTKEGSQAVADAVAGALVPVLHARTQPEATPPPIQP